jgi:hypothetical protein
MRRYYRYDWTGATLSKLKLGPEIEKLFYISLALLTRNLVLPVCGGRKVEHKVQVWCCECWLTNGESALTCSGEWDSSTRGGVALADGGFLLSFTGRNFRHQTAGLAAAPSPPPRHVSRTPPPTRWSTASTALGKDACSGQAFGRPSYLELTGSRNSESVC